jgi:hypothetical protein
MPAAENPMYGPPNELESNDAANEPPKAVLTCLGGGDPDANIRLGEYDPDASGRHGEDDPDARSNDITGCLNERYHSSANEYGYRMDPDENTTAVPLQKTHKNHPGNSYFASAYPENVGAG